MKKSAFIVFSIILLIVLAAIWFLSLNKITVKTNEAEYSSGETLKVLIKNNTSDRISFSDCYPYYFERQNQDDWVTYDYEECDQLDGSDNFIQARSSKTFEIIVPELSELQKGVIHRLMIPICKNCAGLNEFEGQSVIYSNEFLIN